MSFISKNFEVDSDESGAAIIVETGRCTHDETVGIESGCTRRFQIVKIPNATGIVFKSMDGTVPIIRSVTPPTLGRTYRCVKVDGRAKAMTPVQTAGPYLGKAVCSYMRRYIEVGATS